jgi:hypothetical protein
MLPYFYNLNKKIISKELIDKIRQTVFDNVDKFTAFSHRPNEYDGNNYITGETLYSLIPEVLDLKKSFNLNTWAMLVMHKPNTEVIKHKDKKVGRDTVLMMPIHPITNYSSTNFWNQDKDNLITVCEFTDNNSVFFNTQEIHSLHNNNDEYRINLQMCFEEDIQTVVDMYEAGKLFKNN